MRIGRQLAHLVEDRRRLPNFFLGKAHVPDEAVQLGNKQHMISRRRGSRLLITSRQARVTSPGAMFSTCVLPLATVPLACGRLILSRVWPRRVTQEKGRRYMVTAHPPF